MPNAHLSARELTVARGGRTLIDRLSFTANPGSRIAVVGENGRGKTTLLHTLAGRLEPTGGRLSIQGTLAIAEQQMTATGRTVGDAVTHTIRPALNALAALEAATTALTDGQPGAEETFAGALDAAEKLDAWDAERRVRTALAALDAEQDFDVDLGALSVGQRYRVRLACLLGAGDDILLLDEPTNHLDRSGLDFLTRSVRERRGAVILVSHDRALLADVADTVIDLDPTPDGLPRVHGDGYAGYRRGREALRVRWEQDFAEEQARREELRRQLDDAQARLRTGWRPSKGTGRHTRQSHAPGLVQAVRRRRSELEGAAVTVPEPPLQLALPALPVRRGATLLTAEGVTVDGRLDTPVSLTVKGGSRHVVTGRNGAGKTTLLRVLAGDLSPDGGRVQRSAGVRVGSLEQESVLPAEMTAREAYRCHVDALVARGEISDNQFADLDSLGLLRREEADRRVRELSMGQRRRLDLALLFGSLPQVLLLDEPSNHLSIRLVDELTQALEATRAAVVLVTHDRQLLRDTAGWECIGL
ncbi:ABC-F family ATP-binding cassette domain-containing protein [Corynebacterium halotolerans]|uniref:ABC transporter permease n=1 Tax=Corynebacterium halotolerans YIM 70093 = DSM 44683 TaxID=1121362 RepID=M1P6W5_9CORY|nr:ATP-binding cassette domain-containing protein [Corynebacterium halotolerans]AGF72391.1 ABC transporter permease [Corynebacterium halotolerans YIM 70093 = DSM 44683]